MPDSGFVHLHLHSEFSMLDGAARIGQVIKAAADDNQPAVGLTDHGVLYGTVDFYKAATETGIKPIIGVEGYLTPGSRFEQPPPPENVRYHITLLAETQTGYSNLVKLVSRSYTEGYYYKPRMDLDLLSEHAEGLIGTTGCLGGHVPQLLSPDASREEGNAVGPRNKKAAFEAAGGYRDIFGKDRFFVELHNHGLAAQRNITPDLLDISKRLDLPLLATNDAHYTLREEAATHDALLCIQTGSRIDAEDRLRFEGEEYYLKTSREMRQLFPEDEFPKACNNTLLIAERAEIRLDFDKLLLPNFSVPGKHTSLSYLREKVAEGARDRYGGDIGGQVGERIEHEMKIIEDMGFPDYFLIVWDMVSYAKKQGIRVGPGRGSAAGSIVAYSLGITDLDPLRYGLIFERFLNPGRREMPDIDIDFDERRRSDIIAYASDKYGIDHVAQIVTFATIKGRQAIRDSARVLGHPYAVGDRLSKLVPASVVGREASLDMCFDKPDANADQIIKDWYTNASGLREAYLSDPDARQVLDTARGLEGLRRQDSIHAAAVVISPDPLTDLVPVQRKGEGAEVVTQFDMHAVENLGLLKMDILGLRTLATIDRCLDLIEQNTGGRPDINSVDLDDKATYDLLCRGDTIGVFQLEGSAMRALMRSLMPDCFEDLIALVALYRPGPMANNWHHAYANRKNGREPVEYLHPATEEVLKETYGLMIYQEQVMQIARDIAGYSMADADALRKAMGKKIPEIMRKEREKFVAGATANGNKPQFGEKLFELIEGFAGYGFNKSHSAAYGLLAYQTAYLKQHHPAEYMAALLTSSRQDKNKTAVYLNECRTKGLDVLTPSVNMSESDFTVKDGKIVFGLSAVRNLGESMVSKIVDERNENGLFEDFRDFAARSDPSVLNKRLVDSLIKAGGFSQMGHPRKGLSQVYEKLMEAALERRRHEDRGQYSLFAGGAEASEEHVDIPEIEWDAQELLSYEKEMLGRYVSSHPLMELEDAIKSLPGSVCPISDLGAQTDGGRYTVCGIVGGVKRKSTRAGKQMIFFDIEDMSGTAEVLVFPKDVPKSEGMIKEDAVLLVEGRINVSGGEVTIQSHGIRMPALSARPSICLKVHADVLTPENIAEFKKLLVAAPGESQVFVAMFSGRSPKPLRLRLGDSYRVDKTSDALHTGINRLFGEEALA